MAADWNWITGGILLPAILSVRKFFNFFLFVPYYWTAFML